MELGNLTTQPQQPRFSDGNCVRGLTSQDQLQGIVFTLGNVTPSEEALSPFKARCTSDLAEREAAEVLLQVTIRKLFQLGVSADDAVRCSRSAVARTIKEEAVVRGESCETAAKRHAWTSKTVHRNSKPDDVARLLRRAQIETHSRLLQQFLSSGGAASMGEAEAAVRDSSWFHKLRRWKRSDGSHHDPYDDILMPLVKAGGLRVDGHGRFTPIDGRRLPFAALEEHLESVETHCELLAASLFACARDL